MHLPDNAHARQCKDILHIPQNAHIQCTCYKMHTQCICQTDTMHMLENAPHIQCTCQTMHSSHTMAHYLKVLVIRQLCRHLDCCHCLAFFCAAEDLASRNHCARPSVSGPVSRAAP